MGVAQLHACCGGTLLHYVSISLFVYCLSVDAHVGGFDLLATVNSAAHNDRAQNFLEHLFLDLLGRHLRVELLDHMAIFCLTF